ncbi:MAG: UDP-N-acetylmuramate dehydrogenase [Deltaproteobacteria bacterium]|nr:MAG: UDP-N-acetylmuramate dehydrogenase [Deltaproteobacteria bacterium]
MTGAIARLFDNLGGLDGRLLRDEPMARHTSWKAGGPAAIFFRPATIDGLTAALELAGEAGIPWLVVGAGSNLLVRDGGFPGLVACTRALDRLSWQDEDRVRAECGVALPKLARDSADRGLAGIESLVGIPGTLGAAVVINAGASGQEIGQTVRRARIWSRQGGSRWRERTELDFAYRRSSLTDREVVLEVELALRKRDPDRLLQAMTAALTARRKSQTVEGPNAGSVFRNPEGHRAWELIDRAGLRGCRIGGAMVSRVHCNFIVNLGGATATEIEQLIDLVSERVERQCGIRLLPEVKIVGRHKEDKPGEDRT